MKKIIMILMTAAAMTAMGCGDGNNSASETDSDAMDNTELAEPDSTVNELDTTSTQNMDQRKDALEDSETESRNERDTIQ